MGFKKKHGINKSATSPLLLAWLYAAKELAKQDEKMAVAVSKLKHPLKAEDIPIRLTIMRFDLPS